MKSARPLLSAVIALMVIFMAGNAHATKWVVNVQNFSFSPNNLPGVIVGDTIRWVWVSGSHTTTSTTIPGGAASWDHPITSSSTSYEYPVTVAGTYNYKCTPHQSMGMVGSFTATAPNPLLTSISPNQATQGDSFMATITGSGTNFTGSPSVSLSFSNNPGEIITASSVTVISPTIIHAQFTIPASASVGLWDVHVNSLILDNGFTVNLAVPVILSMSPSSANQGASFTGTINGQYTNWSGLPSVYLTFSGNPSEIIQGTNVNVVNGNQLTADFSIPSNASPGFYNVHVNALQLVNGFTVIEVVPAISFMSPNFAHQGDALNSTVFGQNTTWTGTPSVSLTYSLNPSEVITGTNVVVVNGTTLTVDFAIPSGASTGNYTVHVDALQQPNGFTVLASLVPALSGIVPDNGEQGYLVSTTISAENTSFTGTSPAVSLSNHDNPSETIAGTNVVVVNNTTLTADFDVPYEATPGLYDLHVDALTLENSFTVIDVVPFLLSIVPDSAVQGDQVSTLITAEDSRFTLSTPSVSLTYSANPSYVINASNVTVVNDTEVQAEFNIPADALVGLYDVNVDEMMLMEGFTVNIFSGIGEPSAMNARIYPNPASKMFYVENAKGAWMTIVSLEGATVSSQRIGSEKQAVDISELTSGIYMVQLDLSGKKKTERLIVK